MNKEHQRIAIAEACGWKRHSELDYAWCAPHQSDCPLVAELIPVPDYLNDLNAMHEAEKKLSPKDCYIYNANLCKLMGDWTPQSSAPNWVFHATAAQRAEAFLRTLNLWKE